MGFWELISQYMDGYAVIIALAFTQLLKRILPTPPNGNKWNDVVGWAYRILPFVPVIVGVLVVMFKDVWISPTMTWDEALVKGVVSGIAAAYAYRTVKVSIFGGGKNGKNGNGKSCCTEEPKPMTVKEIIDATGGSHE